MMGGVEQVGGCRSGPAMRQVLPQYRARSISSELAPAEFNHSTVAHKKVAIREGKQ
jgi:hypothetical protein